MACLVADSEVPALSAGLRHVTNVAVHALHVLDVRQRARCRDPWARTIPAIVRPDELVELTPPDVLVVSDRRELIDRRTAFAVVELALRGVAVCTVSQFLAAPSASRGPIPEPRVVHHVVAALAASARRRPLKRGADVVLGTLGALLSVPLFVLIAIAIKLDSSGSVFFAQERLGRLERPFRCWKFRTMRQDAEAATGPVWATRDDPRITRIGRLLRRSRLDELPQLLNVIRGEMSLVGARPIRRHFAEQLAAQLPFYQLRFLEKPGLTGLAQVKYDYCSTFTEQIEKFYFDLYYIRHQSLWLDLQIMLMTAWVMVRMRGS